MGGARKIIGKGFFFLAVSVCVSLSVCFCHVYVCMHVCACVNLLMFGGMFECMFYVYMCGGR